MDVTMTMILTPGCVIKFLMANQNILDERYSDWAKVKRMLKSMRVQTVPSKMEFKIIGLNEKPCNQQMFSLKVKSGDNRHDGGEEIEITASEYFTKYRIIELTRPAFMLCLNVGKLKRPNYLPLERCSLVSLQPCTKGLASMQRASLVEKSRQKPTERIEVLNDAVENYRYDNDPLLAACDISIEKQLTQVDGHFLEAPKLKVVYSEDNVPRNGRWNFNNKQLFIPMKIERWAVVNFSSGCDISHLSGALFSGGRKKDIITERPHKLIEEEPQYIIFISLVRVEKVFKQITEKLPGRPQFLLCVLPEPKYSDIYGPWKNKSLRDLGIENQGISPSKINDQYLTNVLLKTNTKLRGTNYLLAIEHLSQVPLIKFTPTMILGMDVSHGSRGRADVPSIAAVVGSQQWHLILRYRAAVRTQSSKIEMIESLFKPLPEGTDDGIMRDGVLNESQFNQVLNNLLDQKIKEGVEKVLP